MSEWYAEGLRFRCTACGACCSGAPGIVWVNEAEIEALAAHLDLDAVEFERRHVRRLGGRRALFERFDGDCIFLDSDSRRCTVYAARPVQCRTWPFWDQNLAHQRAWRETQASCPGAGHGELHSVERIRARLREHRAARERL